MNNLPSATIDNLYKKIEALVTKARTSVLSSVNIAEVCTKFMVGKYIVEEEQHGKNRAQYGQKILKTLSERLTNRFGEGWSYSNLRQVRQFYLIYEKMTDSVCQIGNDKQSLSNFGFTLSWSHYLILMRIKKDDERKFYEIECRKENWSVRKLQREYNSSLYERLALSRNKKDVQRLSREGNVVEKPEDVIKDPLTLEFLGLKPDSSYSESKLESAIISKLQDFLLEMGKGFLFEARQKRFTFDEENFYVDLVLYNRLLQCYVLVDLKIDKLTHQDLGQMQMYVNYYDRYIKQEFEKPTIGILLCKEKKDTLVELTLPKDSNIYASAYELYLPQKSLLQLKMKEWLEELEND